jgi:hypothetical protein
MRLAFCLCAEEYGKSYEKKRSEGKKYTVAVCATARKLVNRIYAVWSRRTPYLSSTI